MKSKTSCFNTAILKKNITLYWPIWLIYTICMLILLMGQLWTNIHYHIRWGTLTESRHLQIMLDSINPATGIFAIMVMSVITAMALHSYLFASKSCNMIHAFPVTRGELYRTNVFTGLLFLIVPIILTFIASIFLCLSYGITCVEYLGIWFVTMAEAAVICYATATFCAMFSGQLFALPIYFIAVNVIGPGMISLFSALVNFLGFGLRVSIDTSNFAWMSPVYFVCNKVCLQGFMENVDREYLCTDLKFFGIGYLSAYLLVAVALFVAAYVIYKKRPLEQAGNLLTVSWLKPVFRWGVGIFGGLSGAFFIVGLIENILGIISKGWILLLALLVGIVVFFVAQMFMEKKFRIFCKRIWIECGCLCVTVLAVFGVLFVTKSQMENFIPPAEQIEEATVQLSYKCGYEKEDVKQVIALHKAILAKKDSFDKLDSWGEHCAGISISYRLKNGKLIERTYIVPSDGEGEEIVDYCLKQESDPVRFTDNFLCASNERIKNVTEGEFDLYDKDYNYVRSTKFTEEQIRQILAAAGEDVKEGNLQKYNLASSWLYDDAPKSFACNLNMYEPYDYRKETDVVQKTGNFLRNSYNYLYEESSNCYIYFNLGEDCTHVIDALLDIGAIQSVDELQVYEENESTEDVEIF